MKITTYAFENAARSKNIFLALFKNEPLTDEEIFLHFPERTKSVLAKFVKEEFRGETDEVKSFWLPEGRPHRIILFGLGEKNKWNERKIPLLPRRMVQYAKREKIKEFATSLKIMSGKNFAENAVLANFEFNAYKEKPKEGWPEVKTIFIAANKNKTNTIKKDIEKGLIIGEEANHCRALANTPGGDMTPRHLAEAAMAIGKRTGIKIKILDEKEIKKMGMGGIMGVARGSDEKPKFIILEYQHGPKNQKPLVLVGKGVTFDTGGLNLKPESAIYEMHMDMSGGAAVLHGMAAIARLKFPLNIIGLIPAVENMPSGSSYRPGDLLKSLSGKIIEVLNTDAEGRIILADALFYGTRFSGGLMVDFATLTGAAHVALGNYCSALFTNRDSLSEKLIEVGKNSGDYVWPLPLWDEYLPEIKGTFGDLANTGRGDRYGGATHGAKFLEQFVGQTPWAHIDIAPKMTTIESEFLAKGASGVGVRYIVELAKEYPKIIE